ncbi:peptidoglycan-binding protein [Pedobacter nyackensis]|uniref:peptidoglycan-binding protein n=1 Tax=Pedobacter nyackensis TaxID=475255 RepID=UPI00292CED30|nr:peptidoglycan-binding protein [Pedobacter nyackensis]
MAAIKFFLGFVCLIVINSSGRVFGSNLSSYGHDGHYLAIIAAARKEEGVYESDVPNSGERIAQYLRYVGIKTPAPWCAAWVSFVFGEAGYSAPKTAWSPDLFPAKRLVKAVRPGIVFGVYYPSLKRIAHCGIVEEVRNNWVFSMEGNTNVNGSREGDGVYRRTRHVRSINRFADWVKNE